MPAYRVAVRPHLPGRWWLMLFQGGRIIEQRVVGSATAADWAVFVWALSDGARGAEALRLGREAYEKVETLKQEVA